MKKLNHLSLVLAPAAVVISLILISFQAQKVNVSGTWNMTVQTSEGSGTPVIVLKQVNDSIITGTYTGQFGQAPLKGKVVSGKINFQISASDLAMDYVGTVEGTAMKGKVIFGSYGEGTFTGKKKEE